MFDYIVLSNASAKGDNLTEYDEAINHIWLEQVRLFTAGRKTRTAAISDFRRLVNDRLFVQSRPN